MHRDVRKYVHEVHAQPTSGSRKDVDSGAERTMGNRVRRFRGPLAAVETGEFNAVGPGGQILKVDRERPYDKGDD